MMKMTNRGIYLLLAAALLAALCFQIARITHPAIASRSIPTRDGWGYEVLVDGNVYIHQEYIPAQHGYAGFPDAKLAAKAGALAAERLRRGKSPALHPEDLAALGLVQK